MLQEASVLSAQLIDDIAPQEIYVHFTTFDCERLSIGPNSGLGSRDEPFPVILTCRTSRSCLAIVAVNMVADTVPVGVVLEELKVLLEIRRHGAGEVIA